MTYSGDVLLQALDNGNLDINYQNGQPDTTDGFETFVLLSIFGEPCVLNGTSKIESEQFVSTFPAIVNRATVSDKTRQDGEKAIEKALAIMVAEKMAQSVTVTGKILSARAIGWQIEIVAPNGVTKYGINWEKGSLTAGFVRIA